MLSQAYLRCKVCHCCMNMSYRRSVATAATGKGFGKVQEREAPKVTWKPSSCCCHASCRYRAMVIELHQRRPDWRICVVAGEER